jgi:hypothetical protein
VTDVVAGTAALGVALAREGDAGLSGSSAWVQLTASTGDTTRGPSDVGNLIILPSETRADTTTVPCIRG